MSTFMTSIQYFAERTKRYAQTHRYSLLLLVLCYTVTQVLIFRQHPLLGPYPDSPSYIDGAHMLSASFFSGNELRAYGYPIFLAVIFALSAQSMTAVVVVQALLLLLTIIEVYMLTYRLTRKQVIAVIPAAILALNIYVAQWERMIMTETLVMWVLVTIFLVLERYLTNPQARGGMMLGIGALTGWAILIRPNYVFLPLLLGVVVAAYHLMQRVPRLAWQRTLLVVGMAYGIVVGQMTINYVSPNHYFGLSIIADVNLFGKIIEYQMEDKTTNPKYAQLKVDVRHFIDQGGNIPWFFLDAHHEYSISFVGAYSSEIIKNHPLTFATNLKRDLFDTTMILPWAYGGIVLPHITPLRQIAEFSRSLFMLYRIVPLLLLLALVWAAHDWRRISPAKLMYITLALFVAMTVLLTAVGNYGGAGYVEYYRLRFPADWALLTVTIGMLFEAAADLFRRFRPAPSEESELDATVKRVAIRATPITNNDA